jgi:hypothetical protein
LATLAALAVVAALLTGEPAGAVDISGTFVDDDGNVHEPNINAIAAAGITAGCGYRLYCPSRAVTRAEMATFLVRALGLTVAASGPFVDIAGNPHEQSINAIAAAGITAGCGTGRFCPNDPVRRDQMATFLVRAFELAPGTGSGFVDVIGNPHAADIAAIAAAGITAGCAPGLYCPAAPVARDQMGSFLTRALHLLPIYPRIPAGPELASTCTKDDQACSVTVSLPWRARYRIQEGFYHVTPATQAELAVFNSAATRVEVTINGGAAAITNLPLVTEGNRSVRYFRAEFGLAPGTHSLQVRWIWNNQLTQTTTMTVVVAGP